MGRLPLNVADRAFSLATSVPSPAPERGIFRSYRLAADVEELRSFDQRERKRWGGRHADKKCINSNAISGEIKTMRSGNP